MSTANANRKICKIVYFDEGSVADYVQIISGGKLEKTTQLLDESVDQGTMGVSLRAGVGIGSVFKSIFGANLSAETDAAMDSSFNSSHMAKNIVTNTVLTDFINIVETEAQTDTNHALKCFNGYKVTAPKESLAYLALISPYMSMLKNGSTIAAGEFNIAVEKLDNTIRAAKGYYEFVGSKRRHRIILRFNLKAFKNNYKASDLLKMDLCIYAVKVGRSKLSHLNVEKELGVDSTSHKQKDNPTYEKTAQMNRPISRDLELDVYDVLLAGVAMND